MNSWLNELCGDGFMPHGQCYLWSPGLVWLHAVADSLIALAYFSIPLTMFYFVRRRRDLPYPTVFLLFCAFIVACGLTHAMSVWTIWEPQYYLSGGLKAVTAAVSLVTAVALVRAVPAALRLPGPEELRRSNEELEARVRARTEDLAATNARLQAELAQRQQAEAEVHRLNLELARRVSELQSLFDLLPVGVGIADDPECRHIRTNAAFAAMLDLAPAANASLSAEDRPRSFRVMQHGRELRPEELPIQTAARENRPILDFAETIERRDGLRLEVLVNAIPLHDAQGRPAGAIATFQDITPLKQMEYELRLVVDAAPNAMLKADARGRITLVNRQVEALFGYDRHELIGQPVEILVPERFRGGHAEHRGGFFGQPSARAMGAGRDLFGRRKDGTEVPIEIGLNPIHTPRGLVVLAAIIDITERKRAAAEQAAMDRKLQESQKLESLGILAGGIAHDFNNLLTGILGNASLLRLEFAPAAAATPIIEQVELSAKRAADLCRQLLAYAGKGRFVVQRLDLNRLVEDTTHLLQISISKHCVLRLNPAPALPAVNADATQLRQIVMNLVINASEAIGTRSGIIALSTGAARLDEAYIATLYQGADVAPGDYAFLEVSDNGSGMDAGTLARIFDPFFTTKFTGRGLGLAAVLGIIRGHRGAIKVYSEPGRGTTFKILLPCADGPAEPAEPAPAGDEPAWRGQGTVLVVDDEETVRAVAARMLERLGYTVVLAGDGREAVEIFRAEPARFALVLLDLTMPHLDGEETFRQLRHLAPGVKVILMSGFNEQEAVSRFTGKGLADFLQKPFEADGLTQAVRRVLLAS